MSRGERRSRFWHRAIIAALAIALGVTGLQVWKASVPPAEAATPAPGPDRPPPLFLTGP